MLEQVRKTIIEHRMLGQGQVAGVAVSGGADSVCLLHILRELAPELGIRLHVVHLDHRLRGEESAGDARFVMELAGSMGLPVTVEGANPGSESGNLEQAAREARRSFFTRLRLDGRVDRIATGHTLSDQAETVLYRILRGSGTAGLSGVLPVTPDEIVRPLLDCSRHQVEQYLLERCITWREDRTNMDPAFARNRIRHVLIPLLEREFSPSVTSILASTASLAQSEENYWSERVSEIFSDLVKNKFKSVLIRADKLSRLHPALARRLVRRAIVEAKGNMRSIDLVHVERIRDLASRPDGHGRIQIPGLDVFRSFEWLRFGTRPTESRSERGFSFNVDLRSGNVFNYQIPEEKGAISLQIRDVSVRKSASVYNGTAADLDLDIIAGPIQLRNWRPGDELELAGRSRQKVKLLFQEFRIPIWDRHLWPVLASGDEILWARNFGASELYKRTDSTQHVLSIGDTGTDFESSESKKSF